ncbi:hypothetical protein A2U01_0055547, partial [Trifolium medium]|nr:hypothetical protein [Trifolium medium]
HHPVIFVNAVSSPNKVIPARQSGRTDAVVHLFKTTDGLLIHIKKPSSLFQRNPPNLAEGCSAPLEETHLLIDIVAIIPLSRKSDIEDLYHEESWSSRCP